jgi:hypothetical protein
MLAISLYPITGVMLGIEIQQDEIGSVLVVDILLIRIMFEWMPNDD